MPEIADDASATDLLNRRCYGARKGIMGLMSQPSRTHSFPKTTAPAKKNPAALRLLTLGILLIAVAGLYFVFREQLGDAFLLILLGLLLRRGLLCESTWLRRNLSVNEIMDELQLRHHGGGQHEGINIRRPHAALHGIQRNA